MQSVYGKLILKFSDAGIKPHDYLTGGRTLLKGRLE
jgi:hypothetical protein